MPFENGKKPSPRRNDHNEGPKMARSRLEVARSLWNLRRETLNAFKLRAAEHQTVSPRIVAFTSGVDPQLIAAAYISGQRHFAEDNLLELERKARDPELCVSCPHIKWHFIGNLCSEDVSSIISVPGLYMIESVDSVKLADNLNAEAMHRAAALKVMVQVNTAEEPEGYGCIPTETTAVVQHILGQCKHLEFVGLMTEGRFGHDPESGPDPDFHWMLYLQHEVAAVTGWKLRNVELSMGRSHDFQHAIDLGSTNIIVRSALFGQERDSPYKPVNKEKKNDSIVEDTLLDRVL